MSEAEQVSQVNMSMARTLLPSITEYVTRGISPLTPREEALRTRNLLAVAPAALAMGDDKSVGEAFAAARNLATTPGFGAVRGGLLNREGTHSHIVSVVVAMVDTVLPKRPDGGAPATTPQAALKR